MVCEDTRDKYSPYGQNGRLRYGKEGTCREDIGKTEIAMRECIVESEV